MFCMDHQRRAQLAETTRNTDRYGQENGEDEEDGKATKRKAVHNEDLYLHAYLLAERLITLYEELMIRVYY